MTDLKTKLRLVANNPKLIARKLNQFSTLIPRYDYTKNKSIFAKDWDNLIILDACNHIVAKQYNWECEYMSAHRSRATNSKEFFLNEVSGRDLTDTVYISANAWVDELYDEADFNLHELIVVDINDPEDMATNVKSIAGKYENKRVVAHFMQPHFPVLSDDYKKVNEEWYADRPMNMWHNKMIDNLNYDITKERLIEAYEANLRTILPIIKNLVEDIRGKTVISADHGQIFDERVRPIPIKMWGHPQGAYANNLLNVPWIVYSGNRKDIEPGENNGVSIQTDQDTKARLEELGYLDA